ncbi:hypothetical protein Mbo2_053 [Rhodococcus phage Mbo2]|uniref:Uncharacterized protein n=1 Tax=Rhodococcus phage Mbo2 TaxID=2936911 RepID=A0A9E7LH78_9CAUD|nr:hypothetical protein Mbo2_053 [Rhodococcus phage Mbo2]
MSDREENSQPRNPFQVLFGIDPEAQERQRMESADLLAEVNGMFTELTPRQVYILSVMVGTAINDNPLGYQWIGKAHATLEHFHHVDQYTGRPHLEGLSE